MAINHISLFEPPFILAFWPKALEAAGAVEIWERPGQNILVRLYGGIPVHRGEYDRHLVEKLIGVLALRIPPADCSGRRTHAHHRHAPTETQAQHTLSTRLMSSVVPVGILGTTDDFLKKALRWERPTIEMHIGAPIHPSAAGRPW